MTGPNLPISRISLIFQELVSLLKTIVILVWTTYGVRLPSPSGRIPKKVLRCKTTIISCEVYKFEGFEITFSFWFYAIFTDSCQIVVKFWGKKLQLMFIWQVEKLTIRYSVFSFLHLSEDGQHFWGCLTFHQCIVCLITDWVIGTNNVRITNDFSIRRFRLNKNKSLIINFYWTKK